MEFWGIEVKPGETVKCNPGEEKYLHLSQVSLGEVKKDKKNEDIPVSVKFNDQKLVVGTLSAEKCAQIPQDLVFEQEFEVFNPSKSTSIYFLGYKTIADVEEQMPYASDLTASDSDDSDEDDEIQFDQKANGKPVPKEKATAGKAKSKEDVLSAKQKAKVDELKKPLVQEEEDEDDDSSDDDDDSSDDSSDEMDADDDSEDSDDEEDDATPKKNESDKRPAGSALKTPVPEKKAKLLSPAASQKSGVTDGKKGGSVHTATPHPNKQMAKTSANADKSKQQASKSPASNVTCKLCSKPFKSDSALQSHNAAKHSAGK